MYVNRFRNASIGADEVISNPNGNNSLVMTERKGKGAVIINLSTSSQNISGNVSLPDGNYFDYINASDFTVANGKITGAIPPRSVAVVSAVELRESDTIQRAYFNDYTRKYKDDTIYAEIVTEDVYSCYYSVNGGTQVPCSTGDKLVIGNSADKTGTTSVTLTAYDFYGDKYVMTYYFTKEEKITSGKKVYFNKPSNWGDKLYAYVYSEGSPVRENKSWPGIPMKEESDGRYSYTFDEDWGSALVIFNDGSNQTGNEAMSSDNIYYVQNGDEALPHPTASHSIVHDNNKHYCEYCHFVAGNHNLTATIDEQTGMKHITCSDCDFVANLDPNIFYFSAPVLWENVNVYMWNDNGDNGWPGVQAQYVGLNEFNQKIYSIDTTGFTSMIFNNGQGSQTADIIKADCGAYNGLYRNDDGSVGYYVYVPENHHE